MTGGEKKGEVIDTHLVYQNTLKFSNNKTEIQAKYNHI